jgi:hypothetical protein
LNREIATHDLNGQLKPAAPLDLEAFIPKPGPPVITEFNVLYSYLEEVAVATKIAEHYEGALNKLRWARFLGSENGRPLVLWVAFNAILMKLGVVLLRSRDRRRSDPGI